MRIVLTTLFFCGALLSLKAQDNRQREMDVFVSSLMEKMTVDEKIGQLNLPAAGDVQTGQAKNSGISQKIKQGSVGGLFNMRGVDKIKEVQRIAVEDSRLGIPLLFGMDVIHGYKTIFPIPLGLAATWDVDAVEESARIAALEASTDGICWTFSPMVDLCRDPRWGRIAEGSGEDPFLGSKMAMAMIRGYQGDNTYKSNHNIMACVKHYALYGASEAGRDYNTVDMSRVRMFNEYMPPYKAAIDAGVGSVMASFNEVDGIPATANKWLMTDLLRTQWGFKGFVVTDYTGINEMVDHGIGDIQIVTKRALKAGIDMDMVSEAFTSYLKSLLNDGSVSYNEIDDACRRILEAKYKLGLFEDPYKYCDPERAKKDIYNDPNRKIARQTAAESFVLLKNEGNLLPLSVKGTIAVIGPLAETRSNMVGTWSVSADLNNPATVVEGIRSIAGKKANILYAKGSNLVADKDYETRSTMFGRSLNRDERTDDELLSEALDIARKSDVIIAVLGESSEMGGESSCRTDIGIPDVQQRLLRALKKTGKPIVLLLFANRPMTLLWENDHIPSILNVWFGGSEAAYAIGDVVFGQVSPCGKLPVTFPRSVGQIPIYYNYKNTGRPATKQSFEKFKSVYIDEKNEPLYPFGYGLSYSTFTYGDISLSAYEMNGSEKITASIVVTNTGKYDAKEVVQLYIRDVVGSITRPVKELKGFKKIFLKKGDSTTVNFTIDCELLRFYNYDLEYVYEPGEFMVMIGGDSMNVKNTHFTLK